MDFFEYLEQRKYLQDLIGWKVHPLNTHYASCLEYILCKNSNGERLTKGEIRATQLDTYLYLDKPKTKPDDNEYISDEEQKKFINEILNHLSIDEKVKRTLHQKGIIY